ncbi:Hypothetical_protein [Hexamita inflata]|nr:Hypothetical protein HINF_LOCUS28104 [Hexamita inflata]
MICALDYINTDNSSVQLFGLIGYCDGYRLTIKYLQTQLYYLSGVVSAGTIGTIEGQECIIIDANILLKVHNNNIGQYFGGLLCSIISEQWEIDNITVSNSHISSQISSGLITSLMTQGSFNKILINSSTAFSNSTSIYSISGALAGDSFGDASKEIVINQICLYNVSIVTLCNIGIYSLSGGLVGDTHETPTKIFNVNIEFSRISANGSVNDTVSSAGLVAIMYNIITIIQNVIINRTNISSFSNTTNVFCSGFLSGLQTKVDIIQSKIYSINLSANGTSTKVGTIMSSNSIDDQFIFIATGLISEGINTVNGINVNNCHNIKSIQDQNGC